MWGCGLDLTESGQGLVAGFCEQGHGHFVSIVKILGCGGNCDHANDYQFLRKDAVSWFVVRRDPLVGYHSSYCRVWVSTRRPDILTEEYHDFRFLLSFLSYHKYIILPSDSVQIKLLKTSVIKQESVRQQLHQEFYSMNFAKRKYLVTMTLMALMTAVARHTCLLFHSWPYRQLLC